MIEWLWLLMQPRSDTLSPIVRSLFFLAEAAAGVPPSSGSIAASIAGHRFEDDAAKAAYEALVRVEVKPYLPRHTLQLQTLSGLKQQFDVVVCDGRRYFIVELKRRSHSEIEQLYAFVAKLLDYALAARLHETGSLFTGLFVSTAPRLNDHFRQFAITYGMIPMARDLPPCQVMEDCADDGLRRDAADLAKRLDVPLPMVVTGRVERSQPAMLLTEWKWMAQRWAHNAVSVSC